MMNISFATSTQTLRHQAYRCIKELTHDLFFMDNDLGLLAVRSNGYFFVGDLRDVFSSSQYPYFSEEVKSMIADEFNLQNIA